MKTRSLIQIFAAVLAATASLSAQQVADSDTSLPVPAPASQPVEVSPYAIGC
jgi:hypothetical protein